MKKLFLILFTIAAMQVNAQLFVSNTSKVSFFSSTPVEDISAENTSAKSVINDANDTIIVRIKVINFKFPKPLMEEHFNEKYMESAKYPDATFKGKISGTFDLTKNGTYNVTANGKLLIHGVEQERTLTGTLTVKDGVITLDCKFKVKLVDHKIEVPSVVTSKIAETIDVHLNIAYKAYVKSK